MSKVLCFDACSTLRCPLAAADNILRIIPTDASKFSLPPDSHVYIVVEADGIREEIRFNGGSTFGGNLSVDRSSRQAFPAGASVCIAITCGYLEDFVCQRVKDCAVDTSTDLGGVLAIDNRWTGTNTFTKQVVFGTAVWDSALVGSTKLLALNSGLWVNYSTEVDEAQYGYLATVARTAGTKPTFGGKHTARGESGVTGDVVGTSSEAWTSPGSQAQLVGGQSIAYSQESNSSARKIGHTAIFRNRPDGVSTTVSGLGANKYNRGSIGYAVQAQPRSSAGEFCGWERGLVFFAGSLDETAGGKAVGIDFSDIETAEVARVEALVRLKFGAGIEWNGDSATYDKLKSAFNRTAGQWGFTWKGNNRLGFLVDNGMLVFSDTGANTPLLTSLAGPASGLSLPIEVNGSIYKIDLRLSQ